MGVWEAVFLVLILLAVLMTSLVYKRFYPAASTLSPVLSLTVDAMFIGLIALLSFVPNLGFITVAPGISLTLVHLPVLLGAAMRGRKKGALYGLAFGVCSWIQALLTGSGFNLFFIYPWVAIPPRVIFGYLAGLAYDLSMKFTKRYLKSLYLGLVSFLLTVLHTSLVFLTLYIFYSGQIAALFGSQDPVTAGASWTFLGVILLGSLGESLLSFILIPSLSLALHKALPKLYAR